MVTGRQAVYQPIACATHERLEFSVLRRLMLDLWLVDGSRLRVLPLDVYTLEKAEWLRFQSADGSEQTIRLDEIKSFDEIP
jgi:Rho-binding antiterminator